MSNLDSEKNGMLGEAQASAPTQRVGTPSIASGKWNEPPINDGLSLRGIVKAFPGVKALNEVDFDVHYGEAVALIGENGAGKSTLMKVLSGVHSPNAGEMFLDGQPYAPSGPAHATACGVVLVHQELSLLPNLTVAENIFLGRFPQRAGLVHRDKMNSDAAALLARVGLAELAPTTLTGRCSVAVQQLVEIAKALSQNPKIIVFDEPSASLGQDEVDVLYTIVEDLKRDGVGIVWITHRLIETHSVADTVVTLRDGSRVKSWDTGKVDLESMVASMVGRDLTHIYPEPVTPKSEVLLEIRQLSRSGEFDNISLELHQGEILGIAGLVGAGRTELLETIAGARKAESGDIILDGQTLDLRSPRDAIRRKIVLVPEDRKGQGLAQRLTIEDNITLPTRAFLRGITPVGKLRTTAKNVKDDVDLRGQLNQLAETLSGGNQQKGVIGKWLPLAPRVFLFDEPTRGIDVGARSAIYTLIHQLAEQGAGVVVVSSELPEIMGISHRVIVLSNGKFAGELQRDEFSEQAIMRLAVSEQILEAQP
ncbi:sugar ABC transporter ATP-binding protein [Schaalia sp. ZJ405]|uniref:sugar ABC transporter ATP-binding protein n=1 Tax=Schaalia sp. ZJ405 TaxID=2709403 RepID=UPI0013EC42C7|nr:sugar ABC transporter ATP-binding protein [Schaalia sp. ZJ405]QPK81239.1 sugar ABC transporter ATP-binding protein [Schaalia sp. ZJ405]